MACEKFGHEGHSWGFVAREALSDEGSQGYNGSFLGAYPLSLGDGQRL